MTDGQWARLELMLPRGKKQGRPPMWTRRQLINGTPWRTRARTPWRHVPECYGPGSRLTLRRALKVTFSRALARSVAAWTPRFTALNAWSGSASSSPLGFLTGWRSRLLRSRSQAGQGGHAEKSSNPVQGVNEAVGAGGRLGRCRGRGRGCVPASRGRTRAVCRPGGRRPGCSCRLSCVSASGTAGPRPPGRWG